jgi:transposase-like protein
MQILHPFVGSIQRYFDEIVDPDRYRPDHCPQCEAKHPLTGHGFYRRTLVDAAFEGVIRVRRYLCCSCKRTVSLLPEFALPWLRFSLSVIALFLAARLLHGLTLPASARAAAQTGMSYQRGQFWIRRFQKQAPALNLALVPLEVPGNPRDPAPDFVSRALRMLESIGWITAHRFLFSKLRVHLLGWPACLIPTGQRSTLAAACPAP